MPSSSSADTINNSEEDALTLYLISKLLRSNPKLGKTYAALRDDVETHKLLGSTRDWQQNLRTRTLEDIDTQNYRVPSRQLQLHLRASSESVLKSSSMSNIGESREGTPGEPGRAGDYAEQNRGTGA
jgi:hypothetical protein